VVLLGGKLTNANPPTAAIDDLWSTVLADCVQCGIRHDVGFKRRVYPTLHPRTEVRSWSICAPICVSIIRARFFDCFCNSGSSARRFHPEGSYH